MAKGNPNSNFPAAKISQIPDVGKFVSGFDKIMELPPCRKNEPEEVQKRIEMMFKFCEENGRRPTVELLSVFLGVSRTGLWKWEHDENSEAGKIIGRAKAAINAIITEIGFSGTSPYQYAIWCQKNNFGYRDVFEFVPGKNVEDDLPSKETIIKKLPDLLPEENGDEESLDDLLGEL